VTAGVLAFTTTVPLGILAAEGAVTERDALRAIRAVRAQVFETHRRAFRFWRANNDPERAAASRARAEEARSEVERYDRRIRRLDG
jgi:hypothetical protein